MSVLDQELEPDDTQIIKSLIDKYDLPMVLLAVIDACHDKIENMNTDWPTIMRHRAWASAAEKITKLVEELYIMQVT